MDEDGFLDQLLLTTFFLLAGEVLDVIDKEESTKLHDHIKEQQRLCRSLPAEKTRPTWTGFCNRVSDGHFRKQFRMSRNAYTNLCSILSKAVAEPFSYSSNGVFSGIIGALDGLAIRIRSPLLKEVSDPGNYYCRKGFFALNVQAICDRSKKFTWVYTSNKGSTHDSVAFSNSRLYSVLTAHSAALEEQGFYLIGDSAYNLTPFILVPYSTDDIRKDSSDMYDAFNFFLSSSRIYIECAFGELVMRWGILWRTLRFDLVKCQRIVHVCMLLHNFIKDEGEKDNSCYDDFNRRPRDSSTTHCERAFPLVSDNNEVPPGGRPTNMQECNRLRGESIRRSITILLQSHGLRRPLYSGMKYNEYGHVFFDGG